MTGVKIKMLMISDSSFEVVPFFYTTLWHSMSTPYYPSASYLPHGRIKMCMALKIVQKLGKLDLAMLQS